MSDLDRGGVLTLGGAVLQLRNRFRGAGLATPELDARILVMHAASVELADIMTNPDLVLGIDVVAEIAAIAERRLAREPVGRIIGRREFWGLDLALSPGTLEPRPDTETLVEAVLTRLHAAGSAEKQLRIIDLGTGSGAILLALLHELPHAIGVGTDISADALATAQTNAERCGLGSRTQFLNRSFGDGPAGLFDVVVSNPPYIESAVIPTLQPEVRDHDPRAALDGGVDGLDAYRTIFTGLGEMVSDSGFAAFEIGASQAGDISHLLHQSGFEPMQPVVDLGGQSRVIVAIRDHGA